MRAGEEGGKRLPREDAKKVRGQIWEFLNRVWKFNRKKLGEERETVLF